jgi:Lon protease-like protein
MNSRPDTRFLRLFPLQSLVLFPGMSLPLVVFEPRYLQLAQECTEADEPFGVALLKEGREVGPNPADPFDIGTTAHIVSSTPVGDGRLSVTAVGGQRFKAHSFSDEHPYLSAQVELLEDTTAQLVEPSLVKHVQEDANAYMRALMVRRGGFVHDIELPSDPAALSFHVAQLFQGDPQIQQRLLERETFDRLWDELDLIERAMSQLAQRPPREGPGPSFSRN